jgi:hypothetical protein
MLIPLGIFAASGAGAGPAYELIQSVNVGTANTAAVFNSIPQTFKHLQIRIYAKNSSLNSDLLVRFNGDTGSNYSRHQLAGDGSSVFSGANTSATSITLNYAMARSSGTNGFGVGIVDVLDYSLTTKNKTLRSFHGSVRPTSTSDHYVSLTSGLWINTSAITSLSFTVGANNFSAGSTFSLYGIKG